MKMSTIKYISVLVSATIILCFIAECAWWYVKPNRQRHYLVSYSYQTPQSAYSGNRTWGSGHCDLKTDYDIATTAGIESCIGYLRDQFIPEHDGPSNSVVIIHWFTTLK